ncbi:hypothetical protein Salat_2676300 [Sesamum alatum]|uniref:Uncharacterized protein n=1 Tax=Sesamum alatum TaxID=300844 RepID=A0AAE1XPK0_9LAMI|nr:hypothetical protein Salat_2676300 [Sesamum alatum]
MLSQQNPFEPSVFSEIPDPASVLGDLLTVITRRREKEAGEGNVHQKASAGKATADEGVGDAQGNAASTIDAARATPKSATPGEREGTRDARCVTMQSRDRPPFIFKLCGHATMIFSDGVRMLGLADHGFRYGEATAFETAVETPEQNSFWGCFPKPHVCGGNRKASGTLI